MIGQELAAARRRAGLTQREVGAHMGLDQPQVSQLEHRDDVHLSTMQRYARALGGRLSVRLSTVVHEQGLTGSGCYRTGSLRVWST